MATHIRHYGSLAKAFRASTRNRKTFGRGSVIAAVDGYYQHTQGRGPGAGIAVDTGATRDATEVGIGRPRYRRVKSRTKGAHHPARSRDVARNALRRYRLGQRVFVSVNHAGGLLSLNLINPRTGKHYTRKEPPNRGFHLPALEYGAEVRDRFQRRWKPEPGR